MLFQLMKTEAILTHHRSSATFFFFWCNSCISWPVVSDAKEVQDEEHGCVPSSLPEGGHPSVPLQ